MRMTRAASRFCIGAPSTLAALLTVFLVGSSSAPRAQSASPAYTPPPAPQKQAAGVEKRLKVFDVLDFDVFSNQKWDRLGESHAQDIVVTWPDGHETHGIATHIDDLKAMFVYAPNI